VAVRHREPADGRDVAGEGEAELAGREVPDLDDAVARAGREPLVARLDRDGAHPAEVAGDDARELPVRVVRRLHGPRRLVELQRLRELGGGRKRRRHRRGRVVDSTDEAGLCEGSGRGGSTGWAVVSIERVRARVELTTGSDGFSCGAGGPRRAYRACLTGERSR
jgi:hypothetical protein